MKYAQIIAACASEPWALEKSKLIAVASFLCRKAAGDKLSAEEIARVTEKAAKEVRRSEGAVAVIPINGVIGERMNMLDDISGGTSTELISKQFRAAVNDDSIKAIIQHINSPGGVARSVEELAQEIYDARGIKPIIAQIDTCAASAAYWVASQADEVVVTPSGQAGSIGVYTIHEDISEMLAQEGIKETLIYAGQYKTLGNPFEPLNEDARAIMQQRVDELASSFVRSVARGRNVSMAQVNDRFGQGLMFNAADLLDRGMVDRIAPMSETLARFGIDLNPALTKAKASQDSARVPSALAERFDAWSRQICDGEMPSPAEFESLLREAGRSKTQSARIASRVHSALRSESGESEATATAIARLRAAAKAFSPTQ